jgi:tRNA threonylcarbamoyladenosine biosynthesis protein TsaE
MDLTTFALISASPEQTQEIGQAIGRSLQPGDVICLDGDLGAGKTTMCAGIGAGWGASEALTSPTYVIVHEHEQAGRKLYHIDAYRLDKEADAESVGLDDIFDGSSIVLIEWPEKVKAWLPKDALWITLKASNNVVSIRRMELEATGERAAALLDVVQKASADAASD